MALEPRRRGRFPREAPSSAQVSPPHWIRPTLLPCPADKEAKAPSTGPLRKRVDRAAARAKLTKAQQIMLDASAGIKPVVDASLPKAKAKGAPTGIHKHLEVKKKTAAGVIGKRRAAMKTTEEQETPEVTDIWGDGAPAPARGAEEAGPSALLGARGGVGKRKLPRRSAPIPAVEVGMPGTSINPTYDDHQDAVALAVADEIRKELRAELLPSIPRDVVAKAKHSGGATGVDDMVVDLDESSDETSGEEEEEGGEGRKRSRNEGRKKTRAERNKRARGKVQVREEEARKALRKQRREIENLEELEKVVAAEEETRAILKERRDATRKERELTEPPKMGRNKFEDMPVQVMATDELTGSLRQVRACAAITKDRFRSLQKRGLIEVTVKQSKRKGKRIQYETGARSDRAREEMADLWALQEKNRKQRRELDMKEQAHDATRAF